MRKREIVDTFFIYLRLVKKRQKSLKSTPMKCQLCAKWQFFDDYTVCRILEWHRIPRIPEYQNTRMAGIPEKLNSGMAGTPCL
jgi:hypothetical protein